MSPYFFFVKKVGLNGLESSVVEELQGILFFLSNFVSLRKTKHIHYVGQKKRILVVEDNEILLGSMQFVLLREGYD
ncbi:hypothetical protein EDF66_101335 [Sphingobacterium sp. JUb20]|nr:hypothetical protein [Sphingobacterium sp. JUb21]TCR10521.1 hypothetical protein EDF66_101335 [Sphingobacterium sp. JUb20]